MKFLSSHQHWQYPKYFSESEFLEKRRVFGNVENSQYREAAPESSEDIEEAMRDNLITKAFNDYIGRVNNEGITKGFHEGLLQVLREKNKGDIWRKGKQEALNERIDKALAKFPQKIQENVKGWNAEKKEYTKLTADISGLNLNTDTYAPADDFSENTTIDLKTVSTELSKIDDAIQSVMNQYDSDPKTNLNNAKYKEANEKLHKLYTYRTLVRYAKQHAELKQQQEIFQDFRTAPPKQESISTKLQSSKDEKAALETEKNNGIAEKIQKAHEGIDSAAGEVLFEQGKIEMYTELQKKENISSQELFELRDYDIYSLFELSDPDPIQKAINEKIDRLALTGEEKSRAQEIQARQVTSYTQEDCEWIILKLGEAPVREILDTNRLDDVLQSIIEGHKEKLQDRKAQQKMSESEKIYLEQRRDHMLPLEIAVKEMEVSLLTYQKTIEGTPRNEAAKNQVIALITSIQGIDALIQTVRSKIPTAKGSEYAKLEAEIDAYKFQLENMKLMLKSAILNTEDPGLIYVFDLYGADGKVSKISLGLENTFRNLSEEVEKTTKSIPQENVRNFFSYFLMVNGSMSPEKFKELVEENSTDKSHFFRNLEVQLNLAEKNSEISRPVTFDALQQSNGFPPDPYFSEMKTSAKEYIQFTYGTLNKEKNDIRRVDEVEYARETGFNIVDASSRYIDQKADFEKAGYSADRWFDADGKFVLAPFKKDVNGKDTTAQPGKELLKKIIPEFSANSKFKNRDEFLTKLETQDPVALEMLRILQNNIKKREIQQPASAQSIKEGRGLLKGLDANDPIKKTYEGMIDMFESGDPVKIASAAILLGTLVFKGIFGKEGKLRTALRAAIVATAAHTAAKSIFGFNALHELGILSSGEKLKGSPLGAWGDALQKRGATSDEWETLALRQEEPKTKALMALHDTPLKELLNWHQAISEAGKEDRIRLLQAPPDPLRSRLRVIDESADKTHNAAIAFGLFSISLREASARYGFTAENPDIGRKLIRAKYFQKQEGEAPDENIKAFGELYKDMGEESADFTFGNFVARETAPSEIEANAEKADNLLLKGEEFFTAHWPDLETYLKSATQWTKERLAIMFGKITQKWGPEGANMVMGLVKDGWDIAEDSFITLSNKLRLVYRQNKETVEIVKKGAKWMVIAPFKAGKYVIETVQENIPLVVAQLSHIKNKIGEVVEKFTMDTKESNTLVKIDNADAIMKVFEDLDMTDEIIASYGIAGSKEKARAILKVICEDLINDKQNFIGKLQKDFASYQNLDWYGSDDVNALRDQKMNISTLHIPRKIIAQTFLFNIPGLEIVQWATDKGTAILRFGGGVLKSTSKVASLNINAIEEPLVVTIEGITPDTAPNLLAAQQRTYIADIMEDNTQAWTHEKIRKVSESTWDQFATKEQLSSTVVKQAYDLMVILFENDILSKDKKNPASVCTEDEMKEKMKNILEVLSSDEVLGGGFLTGFEEVLKEIDGKAKEEAKNIVWRWIKGAATSVGKNLMPWMF